MIPAMVFAAGLGTRMQPLTDTRPKAMIPVAGRPLIDHALDQIQGAGPVVVNAHAHADQLKAHLAGRLIHLVEEQPTPLETGGGLKNALPNLGPDPVLTMNADAVWTGPRAIDTLRAAWDPTRMDGLLLIIPQERTVGHGGGSFRADVAGRLRIDKTGLAYTGAGIVKTDHLARITETAFSLWRLWTPMLESGTLHGVEHPGHWADVGRPTGIALAEEMLAETAR
ncbi:MAG: nucleotidyltransferase family protein [Pseudomonadota bacterium]